MKRKFPNIVTLCGSTKFREAFAEANFNETLKGNIVHSIGCNTKTDTELFGNLSSQEWRLLKAKLEILHLHKIEISDEILVLNVGGYIGESTELEIEYAKSIGKVVRYLEEKKEQ